MISKMKQTAKKKLKNTKQTKWNQVKLEENILTDDNLTFDGFVNLEVLENYDSKLVRKVKQSRDDIDLRSVDRLPKLKSEAKKIVKEDEGDAKEDDIFAEFDKFEFDHVPLKKRKRDDDSDDEDSSKKKPKKKKKKAHKEKHVPGQFVLLKPPTEQEKNGKSQKKVPEKVETTVDPVKNSINVQVST